MTGEPFGGLRKSAVLARDPFFFFTGSLSSFLLRWAAEAKAKEMGRLGLVLWVLPHQMMFVASLQMHGRQMWLQIC
jgi:hypothetical protein